MLVEKFKLPDTILYTYIVSFFISVNISAQDLTPGQDETKIPINLQADFTPAPQSDLNIFLDDGLTLAKAPFNFSSSDWLKTGAFVLATGFAFALDPTVKNSVSSIHSYSIDNATGFGEKYGRSLYAGIFGAGLYLTGEIVKNQEISSTGRMVVESVVYTGLVVGLLKYTIGRARPYENEGPSEFFEHTFTENNISFPSGHTATAFALSTVLSRKIDNTFATIGLYGLAGLTAYQRIYDNKHWFSDVFVGAAIGYFIGTSIADSEEKRRNENTLLDNLNIMPSVSSSGLGLSLHLDF